jgi:hypothetical protein
VLELSSTDIPYLDCQFSCRVYAAKCSNIRAHLLSLRPPCVGLEKNLICVICVASFIKKIFFLSFVILNKNIWPRFCDTTRLVQLRQWQLYFIWKSTTIFNFIFMSALHTQPVSGFNTLNPELNPICYLLDIISSPFSPR